jgi:hypothetical protein
MSLKPNHPSVSWPPDPGGQQLNAESTPDALQFFKNRFVTGGSVIRVVDLPYWQ